jgi:hypothetical protein
MTKSPRRSETSDGEVKHSAVSDADVEAWAERERKRRAEWAEGPTENDKRAYARGEHWRRGGSFGGRRDDVVEGRRVVERVQRDSTLALLGVAAMVAEAPYRLIGSLVRAGREWEDEFHVPPRQRRRVVLDEDD